MAELVARQRGAAPAVRHLAGVPPWAPGDSPRPPRVELVDPLADSRWGAFVARAPGAGVFHHRAWLLLLRRTYGYPMTACCLVDAAGTIRAGAPLAIVGGAARRPRLACLPFAASCPPVPAPEQDPVLARALALALDELGRAMRMPAEVRGAVAPLEAARVSSRWYTHQIPLAPDAQRVLDGAPQAAEILRAARSSARAGLAVERGTDARALGDFYRVHLAARRRAGSPSPPRRFVLGLAHLFDRGLGCLLLVRDRGRAVAGAVLLCFNGTVLLQYGASGTGAADALLRVEAVRWGCRAGMRTLDLGRTAHGDERARELNLAWGAEERELAYHELGPETRARTGRTPGAWAAPLIRNSPAVVGRLIGDAAGGAWA